MWPFKKKQKHIWKTVKEEDLNKRYSDMWNAGSHIEIDYYKKIALHQECLLTGEKRIIEVSERDW